ncbi:MAG: penicillin-binding protein, partial [Lachnospiraceae bacterium]
MNKENENKTPEKSSKSPGSRKKKYINKFIFQAVKTFFLALLVVTVLGGAMAVGMIKGIIDNAPDVDVDSIVPLGYATTVYNASGQVTDTLVMAGSNREEVTYDELPKVLIDAFVAIEDSRFWKHNGIDTRAILRAVSGVITGNSSSGGGSTITQQLIKNNVFNGGRERSFGEKVERKFQEMYLAVKLEKQMDKKLILTNYLNTINLGSNSLGVKVAARRYFGKEVSDLTLSEATVIAGITKGPTKYNPITGQEANSERRKIILQYMYEQGYITKEQQEEALADDVYSRIQNINTLAKEKNNHYSYFTDALISQVTSAFINELGYTETQAHNLLYSGGLSIYTTQDPSLQQIVDSEVNNPENYPDTKYALEYRLTVTDSEKNTHNYSEKDINKYHSDVLHDGFNGLYTTEDAAKADAESYKATVVKDGDTVVGESVKTVLEPQVSFVLMDQKTGAV